LNYFKLKGKFVIRVIEILATNTRKHYTSPRKIGRESVFIEAECTMEQYLFFSFHGTEKRVLLYSFLFIDSQYIYTRATYNRQVDNSQLPVLKIQS